MTHDKIRKIMTFFRKTAPMYSTTKKKAISFQSMFAIGTAVSTGSFHEFCYHLRLRYIHKKSRQTRGRHI